jgi:hypothetical protein
MDIINVYKVDWEINHYINTGLWDNNNKIAIHWPMFTSWYNFNENFKRKFSENFYISYETSNIIEKMSFEYFDINDIVFTNKVWKNFKKAKIYTTIEPKC